MKRKEFENILDLKQKVNKKYDENYIKSLREKAKKSWSKIIDIEKWLREIRGGYDE